MIDQHDLWYSFLLEFLALTGVRADPRVQNGQLFPGGEFSRSFCLEVHGPEDQRVSTAEPRSPTTQDAGTEEFVSVLFSATAQL